jgi:hypothetical protein
MYAQVGRRRGGETWQRLGDRPGCSGGGGAADRRVPSIGFTAYNTVALAEADEDRIGHANTVHSALQQLAIGLGVAIGAVSLRFGAAVLGSGPADTGPYRVALVVIAALILTGAAAGLRLPRDAGELVRSGIAR